MSDAEILICDDEPQIRALYERVLTQAGYRCDQAAEGREAFRMLNRRSYRLVILDINMPEWNGVDAIVSMQLVHPEQRVLVISGFLDDAVRKLLDETKAVLGYLEKPVKPSVLLERVKAALEPGT